MQALPIALMMSCFLATLFFLGKKAGEAGRFKAQMVHASIENLSPHEKLLFLSRSIKKDGIIIWAIVVGMWMLAFLYFRAIGPYHPNSVFIAATALGLTIATFFRELRGALFAFCYVVASLPFMACAFGYQSAAGILSPDGPYHVITDIRGEKKHL